MGIMQTTPMTGERNESIDVLRGMSIIAVVLGHVLVSEDYYSYWADCIRRFCYMFHLPLFFFCSGYLYKRTGLIFRIKKLLKNYYFPFVMLGCITLVMYPFWRRLDIIGNESSGELLSRFFGVLSFHIDGFFMQPMWFLVIFGVCHMEYWCFDFLLKKQKDIVRFIVSFMVGTCGICLVHFFGKGEYYVFLALTMLPLIESGRYWKIQTEFTTRKRDCSKYLPLVVILSFAAMVMLIVFTDGEIELSKCSFFGGIGFYPVITIGIIFCLSVSIILRGGQYEISQCSEEVSLYVWKIQFLDYVWAYNDI